MSNQPGGSVSGFTICIICGIVLICGYILSPVPAFVFLDVVGLSDNERVTSGVQTFYAPVIWAAENNPTINAFYEYQDDFCDRIGLSP